MRAVERLARERSCAVTRVSEVTIPGLTETSLLPKSASCAGYDFDRLVNELVAPSIKRFQERSSLERN